MNPRELVSYIKETDYGMKALEELGCHSIKEKETEVRCALPKHSNPTSLCIYKDNMRVQCFSETSLSGDLFSLVMRLRNYTFGQAIRLLHNVYNVAYSTDTKKPIEKPVNPLEVFQNVKKEYCDMDITDMVAIHDLIYMNSYPMLHEMWAKEGITERTRKAFDIRYSTYRNAIIIPILYWQTGEMVGTNQRTVIPFFKDIGLQKYKLTYSYKKGYNLYGLYENYAEIQNRRTVVVYEAEKSVLKRHSRFDGTGVAVHGHTLSKAQAQILVSLNVDIVIAFDKDVSLFEVRKACDMMWTKRNVYYIYDDSGLLGGTDSPADASLEEYEYLFMTKIYYDEQEHDEYIKELNERNGGVR